MHSKFTLLVFAFLCFYMGCNQYDTNGLLGEWKAVKVLEEGESMKLDINQIAFIFKDNNRYEYRGTVGYMEAGKYILEGDLLLSTDTTRENGKEKAVKILQLEKDNLKIEMLANGKKQTIHLVKK